MKRLLASLVMVVSVSAFAVDSRDVDSAGFDKLTPEQKLQILQQVETLKKEAPQAVEAVTEKAQAVVDVVNDPEAVNGWVEVGNNIGKALVGAAKQMGIAATEFINSPMGKITLWLIVWYVFGNQITHFLVAGVFLVVALRCLREMRKRICEDEIEYDVERKDVFGRSVIKRVKYDISSDGAVGLIICHLIVLTVFILIALTGG